MYNRKIKTLSLPFLLIIPTLVLLVSCKTKGLNNISKPTIQKQNSEKFIPTLEKPFTTELVDYYDALSYWKKRLPQYVDHFPNELDKKNEYKMFFTPGMMQGGSVFELMIKFSDKQDAVDYFEKKSKNYKVEEVDIMKLKSSMYCFDEGFATNKNYQIKNIDVTRMIYPTWCSSQGDRKLGGIRSTIYIDKKKGLVFCVVIDQS